MKILTEADLDLPRGFYILLQILYGIAAYRLRVHHAFIHFSPISTTSTEAAIDAG